MMATLLSATAQRNCGTAEYKQQLLKADPALQDVFRKIEKQLSGSDKPSNGLAKRDTSANEIIYIPVVVHVLYKGTAENISDAQVLSQIDALNKDFRGLNADKNNTPNAFKNLAGDARIQFCLARVDTQGKPTTGINRKKTTQDLFTTDDAMKYDHQGGVSAWDSKKYLNIWVCKLSSRSLGYATPPGAPADKDGVVMAYDVFGTTGNLRAIFNKGRTATHEIGHWLGLIHTWGDDNCGTDYVDDTPTQQSFNFGCPVFPKMSSCSANGNGDMFMNFMDFSDDACMNLFTKGQVTRMRSLFAQQNIRNGFLASFACDSTVAQGGPLPVPAPAPPVLPVVKITVAATKLFPNPVINETLVECKAASATSPKQLQVFNNLGVVVYSTRLVQEKTVLNLSKLVTGIYYVQVTDEQDKFITRIFKQ